MSKRINRGRTFRFVLEVRIDAPDAVKRRAEVRAVEDGVKLEDWRATRRGTSDDLVMLLDPGSFEGGSVFESFAEELPA